MNDKQALGLDMQTSTTLGLSAGTGKLCIFGHLGLVFIWSCFVSRLLFPLYYVICAPVLTEGTQLSTCSTLFLVPFLPLRRDYNVKLPNFMLYGEQLISI